MTLTDSTLLAAIPGDVDAFDAFYRRHVESVERFAVRRCRNPEEVAEVVAVVFATVIDAASSYDARRGSAEAWLLGLARNVIAEERRRWWRDGRLRERVAAERVLDADDYADLHARIDASRQAPELEAAMSELTSAERDLLLLVADGLSVADAARVIGISPVAGRMRLSRARTRARRAMNHALTAALVVEREGTA